MPYRRPRELPNLEDMVQQFESAIKSLVRRFRNHPYAFYTETDMHCYLYHRLYFGGTFNGLYRTAEGHDTILLHKEYPTIARYRRQADKKLRKVTNAGRRGHFDICIWDPRSVKRHPHRGQKILCAAELALNECGANSVHTINDLTKLTDPDNKLKYGYLLFFVRDDNRFALYEQKILRELNEAAERIRVVFALVNKNFKPKPEYLGAWGDV